MEKTWRAGETVDLANVEKKETQFTYAEGDEVRALQAAFCRPCAFVVPPVVQTHTRFKSADAALFVALCVQYVFMDMTTYEETRVPRDEDWAK